MTLSFTIITMTATITKTEDLLGRTFDYDELRDIAQHGCSGGVSGFIYSSELYDVFTKHEDDIMEYLEEWASDVYGKSAEAMIVDTLDCDDWTMQGFRELAVWMYLELNAQMFTMDD